MKISVLQDKLARALTIVSKAVDSRSHLPVLKNVLLDAKGTELVVSATNLTISITVRIGAQVHEAGAITLPHKTIQELVSSLSPERVDLVLNPATHIMTVTCGATVTNMHGIDADEFPPIEHNQQVDIAIHGKLLRQMVSHTAFAAAKDDNRPILTGVYMDFDGENLTMAAADGYRLSVRTARLTQHYEGRAAIVVPAATLAEVGRTISLLGADDDVVEISLPNQRGLVTFTLPGVAITAQTLDGKFPDFAAIIPRNYVTSAVVYTDDLLRACQRAEIFARDSANSGRISLIPPRSTSEPGQIVIRGRSSERGDNTGELDAHIEGEPLDTAFNIRFLEDVLGVIDQERVLFQSAGAEHPGVIRPEGDETFVHVIMPLAR
jgi:DNA polymerase III subunit beta